MLVLDSGAVTHLAERSARAAALIAALRAEGLWPPLVPMSLSGPRSLTIIKTVGGTV
jgi:hypothetical protein